MKEMDAIVSIFGILITFAIIGFAFTLVSGFYLIKYLIGS
jgi:hypothetical protein